MSAEASQEDLGGAFASYVVEARYEDLPAEAVTAAKQSTLDTLGVILGASGLQEAMPGVVKLMREWGGLTESTVLGFGGRLPAHSAAFVNGAMAHGLDFDDHLPEGHHPSSSLVPGLLAVAERLGGVSGRDFLLALAIGQDIFARLRKYVVWKQDWFMTPVVGAFATAAACGKLMGLAEREIVSAFGIASMQAAGTMQVAYGTGGELRGTYAGFAAQTGVFAAHLAQSGLTGTNAPFEGKAGFLEVYFGGEYDRGAMVADLGTRFEGATLLYKLWPSCGVSHGYIATTLKLLGEPGRGDEIERIEVIGGGFAKRLSEPIEERRRPSSVVDAKFSIPYTVALAVARGAVGVGDFGDETRAAADIGAVADKVVFVEDEAFSWSSELPPAAVRITLKSGDVLEGQTTHAETPGSTEHPLSWDDLIAKFKDCAAHARLEFSADRLDRAAERMRHLDRVDDVAVLAEMLA